MNIEQLKLYEGNLDEALADIAYYSKEDYARDIAAFALGIHVAQIPDDAEMAVLPVENL